MQALAPLLSGAATAFAIRQFLLFLAWRAFRARWDWHHSLPPGFRLGQRVPGSSLRFHARIYGLIALMLVLALPLELVARLVGGEDRWALVPWAVLSFAGGVLGLAADRCLMRYWRRPLCLPGA